MMVQYQGEHTYYIFFHHQINGVCVALVTPILKKRFLDHNDLNNYRPVSNPCISAKILENLVLSQVSSIIHQSNNPYISPN